MTGSGALARWDFPGTVSAIAFVIGLMIASTSASAQPSAQTPVPKAPDQGSSILNPPDQTCNIWSDGCRTCRRDTTLSTINCSNIGIACQPREVTCLAPQPDAQKK